MSFSRDGAPSFGVARDDGVVDLAPRLDGRFGTLRAVLAAGALDDVRDAAEGAAPDHALDDVRFLPPIPEPEKILCVGVNYVNRNAEYRDGSEAPNYPSLFMRTAGSLVVHGAAIVRPPESDQLDYEGEIALIIGKAGRRIPQDGAAAHIAGLTCLNDGTIRDWLRHGKFNVTQGKNFERTGAVGPWMTTIDQIADLDALQVTTRVNGELRQDGSTADMLFPLAKLISYISTFAALAPGDVIATGTPPGAGARFDPPRYLQPGDRVDVSVSGVGTLSNSVIDEDADAAG